MRRIAEAGAHDFGGVAEFAEVVVDLLDRLHAWIVGAGVVLAAGFLVPVIDAADKRRNQLHFGFGAGNRLRQGKQQGQVAMDASLLQHFGGPYAFPGRGDLDQHALAVDAGSFIQLDQGVSFVDAALGIEGQARIGFGGNPARDDFQDFLAEGDQQVVDDVGSRQLRVFLDCLAQQRLVFRLLHRFQDQRRIGGGVARRKCLDRLEIAGIGNDGGVLLELFELVHGSVEGQGRLIGSTARKYCAEVLRGSTMRKYCAGMQRENTAEIPSYHSTQFTAVCHAWTDQQYPAWLRSMRSADAFFGLGVKQDCFRQVERQLHLVFRLGRCARVGAASHASVVESGEHQRVRTGRFGQLHGTADFGRMVTAVAVADFRTARAQGVRNMFRTDAEDDFTADPGSDLRILRLHRRQRQQGCLPGVLEFECRAMAIGDQLAAHEIHRWRTDKAGDKQVAWIVVDFLRAAELLHHAILHHGDTVAQGHRFDLVMRDVDDGAAQALMHQLDFGAHLDPQLGVQVRQRFVEQEQRRIARDGAAHGDALPLPA
ncbi:conserved hypothetical protein [Collimonas fungivorans Ter331]|uniref:Uncharacterized protein n=1 Tax=Collimonas fungivorans (strain Ter331) TaxID=1005048 RepID=G0AJQ6_COLFT|nr:conserved hypothetical protein [Collimonas fungivorans Ter331]